MSSNQITKRTLQDRETLKNKSVYSVPDNPSNKGFSAHQLKSKIADPTLLLFDWVKQLSEESFESFENFGSRLEETVRETADKIYEDDFVAGHQATATVVINALTNLNGRILTAFEATLTTISGGYTVFVITRGRNKLDEEQAKNYMEYMTGSRFLPAYEYEKPQNSMWIMADGSFWKPQYDANNGMMLFAIPNPFELKANKVNALSNENTHDQYPSAKAVYDAIIAMKKNSFRKVDTTTYTTEEAFLESTGEEGYMYLYPKDTSDLSKGYHQYIWEVVNNAGVWIYMGDTNLDLTPYVDKTSDQTITGQKTFTSDVNAQGNINVGGTQYFYSSTNNGEDWNIKNTNGTLYYERTGLGYSLAIGGTAVSSVNLVPKSNNSYSLGNSTTRWNVLFLNSDAGVGKVDFGNDATITKDSSNRININNNGTPIIKVGDENSTYCAASWTPDQDNKYFLGTAALRWKSISVATVINANGKLSLRGNPDITVILGNKDSEGAMIPSGNNKNNLGSTTRLWKAVYTTTIGNDTKSVNVADIATKPNFDSPTVYASGTIDGNGQFTVDIETLGVPTPGLYALHYLGAQCYITFTTENIQNAGTTPIIVSCPVLKDGNKYSGLLTITRNTNTLTFTIDTSVGPVSPQGMPWSIYKVM